MSSTLTASVRQTENEEQRRWERAYTQLKVFVETNHPQTGRPVLGPGITQDLSSGGMALTTRQPLQLGQRVYLQIPTEKAPRGIGLPRELHGQGVVTRTQRNAGVNYAAVAFTPNLCDSLELNLFVACLMDEDGQAARN